MSTFHTDISSDPFNPFTFGSVPDCTCTCHIEQEKVKWNYLDTLESVTRKMQWYQVATMMAPPYEIRYE
jgi:hypothetical protein